MPPRGGTVRLLRGSGPADEAEAGCLRIASEVSPGAEGQLGLLCRDVASPGVGSSGVLRGLTGSGLKASWVVAKGESKDQESIGQQLGATRVGCERTREGKNASKRMKLLVESDSAVSGPEQPGCAGPRVCLKGSS
jgi:hypothetical protein